MKNIYTFIFAIMTLFSVQLASAQCTGTASYSGTSPSFTFTNSNVQSMPGSSAFVGYSWAFGDGTYGSGQTTNHTYSTNGIYTVIVNFLDSTSLGACFDNDTLTVSVTGATPNCSAAFNVSGNSPSFTFTPTVPPVSPINYYSYSWDFGDGTIGSSNSMAGVPHTYTVNGTYNVTCILYDSVYCIDSVTNTVVVTNVNPGTCNAAFTFTNNANNQYTFYPTYPTSGATYSWTTSSGLTSTFQNPVLQFTPGTYTACLTITDSAGTCTATNCDSIIVGNPGINEIYGIVSMGNSPADSGVVFLIEYDSILGTLTAVDTTTIDSGSFYIFYNVSPGTYLIKAALSPNSTGYSNYLPTYYVGIPAGGGTFGGELLWSNATYVTSPNQTLGHPIALVAGTNPGGAAFVGGLVSQGANKTDATGDPISDILILITELDGTPVAYQYSDLNGTFHIPNLANGTYIVYPEVYGKVTTPATVVIDETGTSLIRIEVNSTTVTTSIATGINELPILAGVKLYPNPVKDVLHIELGNANISESTIQIMDVRGTVISTSIFNTSEIKINTNQLQTGIYIVKVITNQGEAILKFVK